MIITSSMEQCSLVWECLNKYTDIIYNLSYIIVKFSFLWHSSDKKLVSSKLPGNNKTWNSEEKLTLIKFFTDPLLTYIHQKKIVL
ncbi:hypothetical protein EB796_024880 [Bugula neritina]|uniref:Uncharacterized protein n=1 Tax=Bugula neritina TaxID=10212 RepID=A0A7J7ITE9_BUGNE|nr:hypothetical protein EB796_024880 [Bugula neritina]